MITPSEAVEIYCVKCKAKTASRDIEAVTMKNGRPATRSVCVECGTRKFRIGVLPRPVSVLGLVELGHGHCVLTGAQGDVRFRLSTAHTG